MLGELTIPRSAEDIGQAVAKWHVRLQYAVAALSLAGVAVLCAVMLSKTFFLGSDSANDYAHVWYISDQIFHHARLPLHVTGLEAGRALTFPYAIAPWLVTAIPFAIVGDRAVTFMMVASVASYGYAATRARPALRDPRLLSLIYINTYLIEGLVSFQMAFFWACVFFFLFIEAVDNQRWPLAAALAVLAITTHPFAGAPAVAAYALYALVRRPRDIVPLAAAMAVTALVVLPFALYIRTAPSVAETQRHDLWGTLRFMARYRGLVVVMPLLVSAFAPALRAMYLPVFVAMALTFATRVEAKKVNTFGIDRNTHTFYATYLKSPAFDRALVYRVLEPNDREDGAYQFMRGGAVLGQEFFDQSQFRRWWNSPQQYACFLGVKRIDVVLLEKDYPLKFNQNEDVRLREFQSQGRARIIYHDPKGRFDAWDVRGARQDGARLSDCGL
jgi:ribulose bisphosphate carboxylase small subunit